MVFQDLFNGSASAAIDSRAPDTGTAWVEVLSPAGKFILSGTGYCRHNRAGAAYYKSDFTPVADQLVTLTIVVPLLSGLNGLPGIMARYKTDTTHYRAVLSQPGGVGIRVSLYRYTGTTQNAALITNDNPGWNTNETHTLGLKIVGSTLTLVYDGVDGPSATDSNITGTGTAGLVQPTSSGGDGAQPQFLAYEVDSLDAEEDDEGVLPPDEPAAFELFNSDGTRKYFPHITSCDFELGERGGCLSGNADTIATWEEISLSGTEFLDVLLFDERIYRGWVIVPARNVDSPETASLSLQGFREKLNRIIVRGKYAYGGAGTDLATIAGDIITDWVVNEAGWTITQDMDATDIFLNEFDARGMSVAQALDKLCDHASGTAIWGYTPSWSGTTPVHTLYFRPKPTTTGKYYVIGKDVTGFSYPPDTGSVINIVNLTGGPVKQPNLCYNPSFEEVAPASETVANMLLNPSFEDDSGAGTNWTLTGSIKSTGGGADHRGSPRDGKYWLELDQNTESGIQIVRASYTKQYTGIAWVRQETAGTGRQVKLTLEGLDSGGSTVVSADTGFVTADDEWEKISVDLDTTGSSTVERIRFTVETNGGTANQDGVLVDFTALIEKDGVGQIGWRRIVAGVADATTFEWDYKPATEAYRGLYCVYSDPASIAAGTDYVEIRTTKDKRIEVLPNERLTLLAAFYQSGGSTASVVLGIIEYDSAGAVVATNVGTTETISGGWVLVDFELSGGTDGPGLTTNANTRSVEVFIRHTDNDAVYIDGVFLCQGGVPEDITLGLQSDSSRYWTGENFEHRFTTTNTNGVTGDAANSISTYDERETTETNESVTDYTTGTAWAAEYLNAYAVPSIMARLVLGNLESADELLYPTDDKVQVQNLNDAPDALNPVRIGYQIRGDIISFNADLGSETPSFEALFNLARGREKGRTF